MKPKKVSSLVVSVVALTRSSLSPTPSSLSALSRLVVSLCPSSLSVRRRSCAVVSVDDSRRILCRCRSIFSVASLGPASLSMHASSVSFCLLSRSRVNKKHVKVIGERSPGDKGTLDSYLKASLEDDKNITNSVFQASEVRSVGGPPPHQNANELKRPSSSSLLVQDMQYPRKMRCDSQNIRSLDELAHPLGSKPESVSDKKDKSVSDPMQKIPSNQSAEISMGLRKCTKAPESSTHLTECHTPGSVVKTCVA
uniref:Uncharacterized protein n=2 Tax=Brassica TaxID=3705 RepID=A0A0D3CYT1_BRAOL